VAITTLRDRLAKIGAKVVRHNRSITFQMAEVMVPRGLFEKILSAVAALGCPRMGRTSWLSGECQLTGRFCSDARALAQ
jgi:hypothetical protein